MTQHDSWCNYPSDPCDCWVECENERRTTHKSYCFYPNEPCCCRFEEAKKGECK